MNNENIDKPDVKGELKVSFFILFAFIWIVTMFSEYHKSYLVALTEYEMSYKLNWILDKEPIEQNLIFSFHNQKGKSIKPRGSELSVKNGKTGEVLVSHQFSHFTINNPDIKLISDQEYPLTYPEFYYSPDYSVMLKRKNLYWISKATIESDGQESRIYFKNGDPNSKRYNKIRSTKNLYVFSLISVFMITLGILSVYLFNCLKGYKNNISSMIIAVLGLFCVIYFIFYKLIYVWIQVEFRIF
ncbi:hypothetical protein [Acinetobacter sp. CFCC 10889]|uniref:hypothetical protein n=1 Tax=Acinetobacter sp. CFCC 10889 TaxID=1775557 RepID=UPI000DCFCB46|nr:hypothetical protein [Acinetobacter sp. CFCC 10889]